MVKLILSIDEEKEFNNKNLEFVDELRFGSEFCTRRITSIDKIKKNLDFAQSNKKAISFIYPRINDKEIALVEDQLDYLNTLNFEIPIVVNDFGLIQFIRDNKLENLSVILGRQLIAVPKRAVPPMPTIGGNSKIITNLVDQKLFSLTNCHYKGTLDYLKCISVSGFDFDYVPESFGLLKKFRKQNFIVNIHQGNRIVALSRKCPTARLENESNDYCDNVCQKNSYILEHNVTGKMFLSGNAIFAAETFREEDLTSIFKENFNIVISNSWISKWNDKTQDKTLFGSWRKK